MCTLPITVRRTARGIPHFPRVETPMSDYSDKPMNLVPDPTYAGSGGTIHYERRTDVRYPFTAAAEAIELGSEARICGRTSDLGSSGCYIDTPSPFVIG